MSTRAINLNDVLKYELAAVPTSIFDRKSGELRISKSKSILKQRLQVEVTNPSRLLNREVPETLWLLMEVPYSGCSNGPARMHQGCRVELRQVCHQQDELVQTEICNI